MTIRSKLVIAFLFLALVPAGLASLFVMNAVQKQMRASIGENFQSLAREKANAISAALKARTDEARILATHPLIGEAVRAANRRYAGRTDGEISAALSRIDEAWIEAGGETPEADQILNNDLSLFLKAYQDNNPEKYGEIFLTDARGATVAMTGPLTDYFHADEGWWIGGYGESKGDMLVDDSGYDLSVKAVVVGVVAPVMAEGKVVGLLKINYRVDDILNIVTGSQATKKEKRIFLARSQGTVIIDSEGKTDWALNRADMAHVEMPYDHWSEQEDVHGANIMAHARVAATIFSGLIGKDTKKDVSGEDWRPTTWVVFIELDEEKAFAGIRLIHRVLLAMGSMVVVVVTLFAFGAARWYSRPILHLREGAKIIGDGDLDHRVATDARDEIGELSRAFDGMTKRLRKTLASRDDLNREVAERKQAEVALRDSEERFRSLVANLPGGVIRRVIKPDGTLHYDFISDSIGEVFGIDLQDLMVDATALEKHIHPEDYERFRERLRRSTETLEDMALEMRVLMPDGTIKWAHSAARPRRLENGDVVFDGIVFDITERKQIERALRESEEQVRLLLDSTADGIYGVDPDGDCMFCNPAAAGLLGYEGPGELIGRNMHFLIHHTRTDGTPYPADECRMHDAFRTEQAVHVDDEVFWRADGSSFPVEYSSRPIFWNGDIVGAVNSFRDITERRRTENDLRIREARYRSIVDTALDAIISVDRDGNVTQFNPTAERMFGYRRDEALGNSIGDLVVPDELKEKHEKGLEKFVATGEGAFIGKLVEVEAKRADGSRFPAELLLSMVEDGGNEICTAVVRDITERKLTEQQLWQAQRMDALSTLAGGAAHELNNMLLPMVALTGMTAKALPEGSPERGRLEKVLEAGARAKEIVSRLLAFSRRRVGERKNVDICTAVHESMDLVRHTVPSSIEIVERLDEGTGIVFADAGQIDAVLIDLASNSADAMAGKAGEIEISLSRVAVGEASAVSVGGLEAGEYAKLTVADSGSGMDDKTLDRIFDPFFTTKEVGEGAGLGLSLVYGIIEDHGGAIDVASQPGKGTTVDVYLPLVEAEATR